jgi:hypothetical protein
MYYSNSLVVPTRMALAGMVLGALSGLAVAQMNPGPTFAAVVSRAPFSEGKALDTNIAKFDGNYFAIANEPDVSMEPESSAVVRKIGYGQTRFVTINTTSTGTYSSDGLASPNIRYPGIFKEPLRLADLGAGDIFGWSSLSGWVRIPLLSANSISYLYDDSVPASRDGVCVTDTANGGCR